MQPHRRTVLLGGATLLTAACQSKKPHVPLPVDPDIALRAAAVQREQALLAAYDAALAAKATPLLTALRAEHAAHLTALGGAPATVPAPAFARADLVRLERTTATEHARAVLAASGQLAGLLASLAAAESSHLVVL